MSGRCRLPSDAVTRFSRTRPSVSSSSTWTPSSVTVGSSASRVARSRTRLDVGIVDGLVGVLAQAGAAADEPDRGAVDDRELALQAGVDVRLAAEVDDERRDVQAQRGDVAGRDAVLVVQLDARVDRGVIDDPARERLVRVDVQLPRRAEAVGDLAQVVLGRRHRRPAARALDAVGAAREALLRQQRGGVAVLRGAARVQRLAHRAELLAHAGGLGPARPIAQTICCAVEPQQRADRDRRAEHADAAGAVPAGRVVRRVRGVAQPRRGLEAEHERVDEVAARDAVRARVGQQRGGDRRAGVDVVARQRVVEVLDVRRDAVQQRGVQRVRALRPAEHGRVGRAEHRAERVDRDVDRRVWRATERAPDDVDQRAPSLVHHVGRDVIRPAGGEPAGEVLRRPHGGIGSWGGSR